jgi:hypothetical protein
MYPQVTQFETIDNHARELLRADADATPKPKPRARRPWRLFARIPRVTSQPCR